MSQEEIYDPTAPEGAGRSSSAYVTRKDVKIVGIALVILAAMFYPVFRVLERRSEKAKCILNMKGISDSINQYATQNEDKFPPLFDTGAVDGPVLQASGAPYTWASDLHEYMNPRVSFKCPSSQSEENSYSQNPRTSSGKFPVSYGMFAPLGAFSRSLVDNPDDAILLAETCNRGARKTYDPKPFLDENGKPLPYDGMVIGWDNDNFDADPKSSYVTRLAFPDSDGPVFADKGEGRHDEGSFMLTVTGHLMMVRPNAAKVQRRRTGDLFGMWPMPLTAKRHP